MLSNLFDSEFGIKVAWKGSELLRQDFKLILTRRRSQPIKSWRDGFEPITERAQGINLKTHLSQKWFESGFFLV